MKNLWDIIVNTPQFLLATISISLLLKGVLVGILLPQRLRAATVKKPLLLLIGVIVGSMVGEFSWCIKLMRVLFIPEIPYALVIFSVRVAWAFLIIQYLALGLFLESLTERAFKLNILQKIVILVSSALILYYLYLAFFSGMLTNEEERFTALALATSISPFWEITIMRHTVLFVLPMLIAPGFYFALRKLHSNTLPKILNHQLSVIIKYLMAPYLVAELLIAIHFEFQSLKLYTNVIVGFSAVLITYIVYYCIRRVMGMRFLNSSGHVQSHHSFNFIDDFKIVLEQLSFATTIQELSQFTAGFFKESCNISPRKVTLYIRPHSIQTDPGYTRNNSIEQHVEEFLTTHNNVSDAYIKDTKILIYDEISFSNFYHSDQTRSHILRFLEQIHSDIFLPIYQKEKMIAYIVIDKDARPRELYSNVERDEMLVYARYLGNIIHLLQNRNLEALMLQERELKEEIYCKHQEINQYKESMRSFLKHTKHKEIGIIFYKQRRFIFANQSAKEMVKININTHEGHPLTRTLKTIARQVEEYKAPQTCFTKDADGTRLVIAGVPNLESNNVILTICYPDIADIIAPQISLLKDPSKWDYLLYLETTKPGKLINQLIPGSGETLLNFKITLLQTALSQKATLLEMAEEDLIPTVELLHHISMRETLYILTLQSPCTSHETAIKIFGINPLYGSLGEQKALIERLNGSGTLFIQNVEYLDSETQEYLAEFIKYGLYRPYKSEQKIASTVRIICSTNQNLNAMVQDGKFSSALCSALKKTSIIMPSLLTLPDKEIQELASGFTEQALHARDFTNLLTLSDKDKVRITHNRPVSLHALKNKIHGILIQKSKENHIDQEVYFDPAYETSDPELVTAARLGKHALRDHKIMVMLWNKFKNQNKIASFLGVNRSSVNRRCKEYNLS